LHNGGLGWSQSFVSLETGNPSGATHSNFQVFKVEWNELKSLDELENVAMGF